MVMGKWDVTIFPGLNDEQMSNKVGVEHQLDQFVVFCCFPNV